MKSLNLITCTEIPVHPRTRRPKKNAPPCGKPAAWRVTGPNEEHAFCSDCAQKYFNRLSDRYKWEEIS